MSKLDIVKRKAKQLGLDGQIRVSTNKNKKFDYIDKNGKKVSFGAVGYSDYLEHKDEERRKRYHQRFKGVKNYNKKGTANYLSQKLLW